MLGSLVKCSERQVRWWVDNINRGRQVSGIWTAEVVESGSDERDPYPPLFYSPRSPPKLLQNPSHLERGRRLHSGFWQPGVGGVHLG